MENSIRFKCFSNLSSVIGSQQVDQFVVVNFDHVNRDSNLKLARTFLDQLKYSVECSRRQTRLVVIADNRVRFATASLSVGAYANCLANIN